LGWWCEAVKDKSNAELVEMLEDVNWVCGEMVGQCGGGVKRKLEESKEAQKVRVSKRLVSCFME
jgi:hypothetical protein